MKLDKKYFGLLPLLGLPLLVIAFFVKIWNFVELDLSYGLFDNLTDDLNPIYTFFGQEFKPLWATVFSIVALVALLILVTISILIIFEFAGIAKTECKKVKRYLGFALIGLFVIGLVVGIIFIIQNSFIHLTVSYSVVALTGFYFALVGMLVAGSLSLITTCPKCAD